MKLLSMLVEMDPFQNKMTIYELFDWKQLERKEKQWLFL